MTHTLRFKGRVGVSQVRKVGVRGVQKEEECSRQTRSQSGNFHNSSSIICLISSSERISGSFQAAKEGED